MFGLRPFGNSKNSLSRFKVRESKREIEFQEVLLDSFAQKKEKELGISEKRLETPLSQAIFRGFWFAFLVLMLLLFARTFQLQVFKKDAYALKSEQNRSRINILRPERGVIYDKNMKQLVFNQSSFDLICDKRDLPRDEKAKAAVLKEVAGIIQEDAGEIEANLKESEWSYVLIAENLPHETLVLLESKINDLVGFQIEENTVRNYVDSYNFSHLLGYTSKINVAELKSHEDYSPTDYIGKNGLEKVYETALRGKPGELLIEENASGQKVGKTTKTESEPGQSLVLYLDAGLQEKIEEALKNVLNNIGGRKAAAIALDPRNGGVLALVSLPSFDNNKLSQGISQKDFSAIQNNSASPLFNKAISGFGYPSGSTIKPLIGLAALEEGIIKPETKLYCPLEICIQNPWYPEKEDCYADWKYHGTSDLQRAIAESVNTFFYQVGGGYEGFQGLGASKIKKWLQAFNWGSKTGIDLPEEGQGILPNLENNWTVGNTYHLSIGQGPFSVTPLQVAAAYVALANGGDVFKPQIVQKIIDNSKNVIWQAEPEIIKTISTTGNNLEVVRQGMKQAVTSPQGSSYLLNFLPVTAAAKTGTAQTGTEDVYHNWVTVFAPYDNPEIVLTVVIEDVQGVQAAALPVARDALMWYFGR
jgi:penicillin-binding protein 2